MVGTISFIGLLADAGYLSGVGGIAPNLVAAVTKVICKIADFSLIKYLIKQTKNIIEFVKTIFTYASRIPGDPIGKISKCLTQWDRLLHSDLLAKGFGKEVAGDTIILLTKNGAKHFTEEAAEGVARVIKAGEKNLAETLFKQYGDEIAEKTFEGVQVAQKAIGPDSPLVENILKASQFKNVPENAKTAFNNIKQLEGVDGMSDYVDFLKRNSTNKDGAFGAIYESTVAVKIKKGQVSGSGSLTRIGAEAAGNNKIDTVTAEWAIQVKSKLTVPPNFGLSQISKDDPIAYLTTLRDQALTLGKTPVLITNVPITKALQDELTRLNVLWRQVPQ